VSFGQGVARPQRALLLDLAQGGVEVGDVHARPDVLLGHAPQPGPGHGAHLDVAFLAPGGRRGGGDEVGDGPVEDVGRELVQALADRDEEFELLAPLLEGPAEGDVGVLGDPLHLVAEFGDLGGELLGEAVRVLGLLAVEQLGAVPRALRGRLAEAAQFRGTLEPLGEFLAVGDGVQDAALEAHRGGRCRIERGEAGEGLHGLVGRAPPAAADVVEAPHMLHELVAVPGERGVERLELRLDGLLVADEGADDGLAQLGRPGLAADLEHERAQVEPVEVLHELVEGAAALRGDDDALAVGGGAGGDVQGGLGLARPGRGGHDEADARGREVEDLLLGLVGVEDQDLLGRVPLVGGREPESVRRTREGRCVVRVPTGRTQQRGEHRMVGAEGRIALDPGEVGEGGDQDPVFHGHAAHPLAQHAHAFEDGMRIEARGAVGEAGDAGGVHAQALLVPQVPDECRVHAGLLGDLQLVVVL
jgi:hypothetical protein